MSIYSFRGGPQYRGAARGEQFIEALDQPLGIGSTLADQFVGGVLESYGLGTAVKDATIPQGDVDTSPGLSDISLPGLIYNTGQRLKSMTEPESPSLSDEEYKQSPYYRGRIPWNDAMTEDRAAALAIMDDSRSVREYYAQKRPIASFFGNLAGQAMDPINYIPIAGPAVRAAAIAKAGRYGGRAVVSAGDAAANTALFGLATADERGRYGDDVSWEALTSEIASAALIGAAFGTVSGVFSARSEAKVNNALIRLKEVQESRAALNDAVSSISRGEDVDITPAVQNYIRAFHGSPHDFDRFDINRIGTGEGAQARGYGLYFAEEPVVARTYQDDLTRRIVIDGETFLERNRQVGTTGNRSLDDYILAENGDMDAVISGIRQEIEGLTERGQVSRRPLNEMLSLAEDLRSRDAVNVESSGNLYEVDIKASRDDFIDYDKQLKDQSENVKDAINRVARLPETFGLDRVTDDLRGVELKRLLDNPRAVSELQRQGVKGIKFLDQGSRGAGDGTLNYVVFDDALIDIVKKNGVDFSPARPEPAPEGRNAAEKAIGKPDDYKALTEQYRVDPETGSFNEEADIAQLEAEGRLTEADQGILTEAQNDLDDGAAYGEALKAAVGCIA